MSPFNDNLLLIRQEKPFLFLKLQLSRENYENPSENPEKKNKKNIKKTI